MCTLRYIIIILAVFIRFISYYNAFRLKNGDEKHRNGVMAVLFFTLIHNAKIN